MAYVVVDTTGRIVGMTDAYLEATQRTRSQLVGENIVEAFPDDPDDPDANGNQVLSDSLDRCFNSAKVEYLAIQRYDINLPGQGFVERYWRPVNAPVIGSNGKVQYVIHGSEDVTESVRRRS